MSMNHHGSGRQAPSAELEAVMRRFNEQVAGKANREYPAGRMGHDDDGVLSYAVVTDPVKKVVVVRFGKPVEWIGLGAKECVQLAEVLIKRAREITTEPLEVSLT